MLILIWGRIRQFQADTWSAISGLCYSTGCLHTEAMKQMQMQIHNQLV